MEAQLANLVTTLTAFVERLPTASQEARAASTSQAQSVGRSVKTILQTISTSFEHFDENAESFDNYIQRLENFLAMKGLGLSESASAAEKAEVDEAKRLLFINCLGAKYFELLSNLTAPNRPADTSYEEAVSLLREHLSPKQNVLTEQHRFFSRSQGATESVSDFVTALKHLIKTAEFKCECEAAATCSKSIMNLVLRAQLIRGLRDSDIREKILQKEDISFDDCLKTALAIEVSKIENKEAYKNSSVNINKISDRQQKFQPRQPFRKSFVSHTKKAPVDLDKLGLRGLCLHCGGRHTSKSCRIKKKLRCKSCSQKYHTEKVCIKSLLNKTRDVHFLDDGYDQSSSDTDEEIGINHVLEVFSNEQFKGSDDRMLVQLLLNNNQHTFECDSGCRVTIMSLSNFKSLNLNTALKHTDVTLRSFTGHIFRPVGVAKVTVSYKKVKQLLDLYIIDLEKDSIVGRDWIRSLNIDLNQIPCSNISTIRTAFSPQREAKLIFSKFSDVFEKKIGTVPNYTVSLQFRNDARPVFLKPRTVPYAIKEQVETEIRKLEAEGIIEKTNSSAWGTPLVVIPKPNGELRLCADYKVTVNSQLLDSRYPIPNQEEIFNKIQDGKIFCSLDIYRAFLHLPLDAPSSEALTISTHMGTYTVKKLFFGVKTAPNIFHQFIDQIIQDLPGTTAFFDDCIVKGRDFEECKQNLEILLNKFRKNNLHLNPDKCHLFKEKISYLGHVISAHGIHKAPDKIEAVIKARPPRNVDELRQFLGLVTYYSKFFPDRATMLSPLNELLRKNHPFTWTSKCQIAFEAAKREVASDRVLVPFSTELPLILATDASPHGLAGVLSHLMPNGDERPIIFISRSLTEAEAVQDGERGTNLWKMDD
ncbi:Hypothetical Protein NTJ_11805 [Nesidiocoris tenuis]|uniref:Reverse transcriptase domain-containing protein n=1 Tax=Nesidiocoris tenuis TaxID=355587 RepID=A0ABN7B577_9HEMI|nr:Hypothetical Protein NTJ_11805 [Nesidiocoris tenuis]